MSAGVLTATPADESHVRGQFGHRRAPVHFLFWTGARPSEAAGLRWTDVDLQAGIVRIARSRHLREESAPKTGQSARTVELLPETVRILQAIFPLRVDPTLAAP